MRRAQTNRVALVETEKSYENTRQQTQSVQLHQRTSGVRAFHGVWYLGQALACGFLSWWLYFLNTSAVFSLCFQPSFTSRA